MAHRRVRSHLDMLEALMSVPEPTLCHSSGCSAGHFPRIPGNKMVALSTLFGEQGVLFALGQHAALSATARILVEGERLIDFLDDISVSIRPERAEVCPHLELELWRHSLSRISVHVKTQVLELCHSSGCSVGHLR